MDLQAVILSPHTSEKSSQKRHIFKVARRANKLLIKKACRHILNLEVKKVRIINVPRKKRRLGKSQGFRPGYKKAIVILKHEQKTKVKKNK